MGNSILGVGIATVDVVHTLADYPREDEEIRSLSQQRCRGGNVANTLAILSALGHSVYFAGTVADDHHGEFILHDLNHRNINTRFSQYIKNSISPVSQVLLNTKTGSRTIIHSRDLPEFTYDDFCNINLDLFKWVHFEGRAINELEKILLFLEQEHTHIKVSIEIEKPRKGIEKLWRFGNILFISKNYATQCGYDNAAAILNKIQTQSNADAIVCAWGDKGATMLDSEGGEYYAPANHPQKVVDTLGAGDVFNAGVIHGCLKGEPYQQLLDGACFLAGKKCSISGLDFL